MATARASRVGELVAELVLRGIFQLIEEDAVFLCREWTLMSMTGIKTKSDEE